MICNFQMERLLASRHPEDVEPDHQYQVWTAKTVDGNPFWGAGNFCGLDTGHVIRYGRELTDLEWDGNELYVSGEDAPGQAFAIYRSIKMQLQEKFPDTEFDLMVSVNSEDQNAVVRFWAVRDGYHYVDAERRTLDGFKEEAVLIDQINRVDIKQQAALFMTCYKDYLLEIREQPDEIEAVLNNPSGGGDIHVWFEDEITMVFGRFHAHYAYGEEEELKSDIDRILSGGLCVACMEGQEGWLGSSLVPPDEIPLESRKKLLQYFFGRNKDACRKVKEHGGRLTLTFWDAGQNRVYEITGAGVVLVVC